MTSPSESRDSLAALNQVLSELIDLVQDVKQAHRRVPENHSLHAELDALFADLRRWAESLMEEDDARGVSPLASIASVAGRHPKNLWPTTASDDEVRHTLLELLGRLSHHLSAALEGQGGDERVRSLLAQIEDELRSHIQELSVSEA